MTMTADTGQDSGTDLKDGRVVAIAGPVVDVEFPPHALPEINWALELDIELEEAVKPRFRDRLGKARLAEIEESATRAIDEAIAARLVGRDHTTDIALLRVDRSDQPPIRLEESKPWLGARQPGYRDRAIGQSARATPLCRRVLRRNRPCPPPDSVHDPRGARPPSSR